MSLLPLLIKRCYNQAFPFYLYLEVRQKRIINGVNPTLNPPEQALHDLTILASRLVEALSLLDVNTLT